MRYLKKINEFANSDYYDYDEVKEYIGEFLDEEYFPSFSRYFNRDGNEDIAKLRKFLKEYNIDLDKFMKDYLEKILDDDFFIYANGFMDYLIYCYDKKYPLGGEEMRSVDDVMVKFDYGYHKFNLGKKYILQTYESLGAYFEMAVDCLFTNKLKEESYFINKYDNSNVFVFVAPSISGLDVNKILHLFNGSETNSFKLNSNVLFIHLGDLDIEDGDDLEKYYNYDEVVKELDFLATTKKYNL